MNRINNNKRNNKKKNEKIEQDNVAEKKVVKKKTKQAPPKKVKKEKKKSGIRRFFAKLFLLVLLLLIIFGVLFYKKTEENGGGVKGALITALGLSVENVEDLETINVLVLGISEDISSKLTDTIILCSYNPETQAASMISIPRDTFVGKNKASAKGNDKINSLYAKNPEKLLKTVSDITGIDVEYYAVVKTQALIEIVDIIGGVDFEVPIDMDYDDPTQDLHIHLEKGMQKIDGEKAEQLLRFRHNNDGSSYPAEYGDNDYGRMKTQRAFMTETIKQTLNVKNLFKAKTIIDAVFANVETNLEIRELKPYIPAATEFEIDSIVSKQLPGVSEKCNDLWFFVHNKKETKELIKSLDI
ncbi:MAG: LCP family protein [Clostridia bacterium]|nr:LCP family protein [Clostridia bacterium]